MRSDNWGRWGDDDERGTLNTITTEVVLTGAAAIRTGNVYPLGIPLQAQGVPHISYRGKPLRLTLMDATDAGAFAQYGCKPGTGAHEDVVTFASHATTHMDALVHVYEDNHHYNGVPAGTMHAMTGASRLGIEKARGFASRAVLLDMVRYFANPRWLEPGRVITGADLQGAAEAEGVEVGSGDIVLIRTGFLDMWWNSDGTYTGPQAGIGVDAGQWLADRDVAAVGSDNAGVECGPADGGDFLAVHKLLLVRYGIHMLEFLDLSAPARDLCWEGLLAVAPLKITGATGCPINPIYIG